MSSTMSCAENAASANTFANILMPIMMNIGNLLYVLVAVVGGALALSGVVGNSITIGVIASFLQLTKSFTQPVTQISAAVQLHRYGACRCRAYL